jgi:integrase
MPPEDARMARTLQDAKLNTRSARQRLEQRREPYWRLISEGMAIGYRKGAKGGTWIARHYSPEHGRRYHSIGTTDDVVDADGVHVLSFAQAQEKAREWFAELARRDGGGGQPAGPFTVKACLDEYLTWLEEHRKTARDVRYRAEALILPVLGHVECGKLTTAQIQKWHRDMASTPARLRTKKRAKNHNVRVLPEDDAEARRSRRSSANRVLAMLRAALNRAWRAGKIPFDDAWRRVEPFKEADTARVRYLSVAEAKRLVNACESEFRKLVQAALATGARYGELAALRVADFNPDSHTVHVRTSKSGKARHIILSDEGVALFKTLVAGKAGDAILLAKADGTGWGKSHQDEPIEEACGHAQIQPPISFHILRHTWASHAVMNGVPLMVVARNLGHADTRMVEKHYGHLAPSYVVDAIKKGAPAFGIEPDADVVPLDERRTRDSGR